MDASPPSWTLRLTDTVRRAIRAVAIAADDTDDYRPNLTCVHLSADRGRLRLAATDSYRLHVARLVNVEAPDGLDVLIPARWLTRTVGCWRADLEPLEVVIADRRATVEGGAETWSMRLAHGDYPDTAKLLDEHRATKNDGAFVGRMKHIHDVVVACDLFQQWRVTPVQVRVADGLLPALFTLTTDEVEFEALVMPVRT